MRVSATVRNARQDPPGRRCRDRWLSGNEWLVQLVVVGFLEQFDNFRRGLCLSEEVAEVRVPQVPGNALQPTQVVAGEIGRRNQQKQDMHSFAIEAGEVNTPIGECHGGSQLIDGGVLGVRDGDTVADSGRSEPPTGGGDGSGGGSSGDGPARAITSFPV